MSDNDFTVHPYAARFPMLDAEELNELAIDIQENGLLNPIILSYDGSQLVDGRNRLAACKLAEVEPTFRKLDKDEDLYRYIISANLICRHLTKGQQAMAMAMIYPEAQKGGRGKKATLVSGEFTQQRLSEARAVLRYSRSLAESVVKGKTSLDSALATVKQAEHLRLSNDAKMTRLRESSPRLAEQVKDERLTLDEAIAALDAVEKANSEARARGHRVAREIVDRFVDAVSAIESAIQCGATIVLEPQLMEQYVKAHALFMKRQNAIPSDNSTS